MNENKRNNDIKKTDTGMADIRAMRIMEALSGADEELLERSSRPVRARAAGFRRGRSGKPAPFWRYAGTWAAVLCLAAVGAASWGGYRFMQDSGASGSGGPASADKVPLMEEASLTEAGGTEAAAEEGAAEEAMPEEGADGAVGAQQAQMDGGRTEKAEQEPDRENSVQSGFTEEKSKDTAESVTEDMASCLKDPSLAYTEKEARAQEKTGSFIPAVIPQGYVFESASRNTDTEKANLAVCWTRGMDSIMLFIEETENPPVTVDLEKAETYDLRLYEVPYGESVPEQYRESVGQPVFAIEDLSLEVVESRMVSYDDAGDTDTPRGSFSVLYPDGMLVRFNGRGTASEIWEMFCSIEE